MIELAASSPVFRLLTLSLIFAAVFGVAMLFINISQTRRRVSRQISKLSKEQFAQETDIVKTDRNGRWASLAESIEKAGINLSDSKNLKVERQLKLAGYRGRSAARIYTMSRIILVFVLPGLYLFASWMDPVPPDTLRLYLFSIALSAIGLYLPNLFIRAKADRRRTEIVNGFPDTLDLLLICVEAGLGLESALDRVGREISRSYPLIASLLIETTLLMRAGASREVALRQLAENSGVDEIRSFSTLLIQSDKLGTSIANTLRVYASEMREARRMRAEEKAHRIPVLISIPLVTCMLPTMIGVLVLPAAVLFIRDVGPAMTGG